MNGINNSVETVNAAATAIVTAESRVQQVTSPQKRRWGGWLSMYWCFGSQRNDKRINHAVVIPETTVPGSNPAVPENVPLPSTLALPFVAPPPSPASCLQSEPSSAIHSPVGLFSLAPLSVNSTSPGGTASIFAIGPYAYETQLVSPPAFTTEPSTAPFTPPPESVQFTYPPSPEVPFAQLLMSSLDISNLRKGDYNEFYTYQLYPGSPIGNLISPRSLCSGTSSPFPDLEFHSSMANGFSSLPMAEPPMLLNAEDLALPKVIPPQLRRGILVSESQITVTESIEGIKNNTQEPNPLLDHRLSFILADEEVTDCPEKEPAAAAATRMESDKPSNATQIEIGTLQRVDEVESIIGCHIGESHENVSDKLQPSASDRAEKEFMFDNADGTSSEPTDVRSDWWTNEKLISTETGESKNWSFFPLKQPGVS